MNKCVAIFLAGMVVATASYAFFNKMMQMPGQMMQMPQQVMGTMMVGGQPSECTCITGKEK